MALKTIFGNIKRPLNCPVLIVIHRQKNLDSRLDEVLRYSTMLTIKEAEDKETLQNGFIYLAPGDYHMLLEQDDTIKLSKSERVNFSRPSIDVTFNSVAQLYKENTTGIILTGANEDGAYGLGTISSKGGKTIVQRPDEAQISVMPQSALIMAPKSKKMSLNEISDYLVSHHTD